MNDKKLLKSPIKNLLEIDDIKPFLKVAGNQKLDLCQQGISFENKQLQILSGEQVSLDLSESDYSDLQIFLDKNAVLNLDIFENQYLSNLKIEILDGASLKLNIIKKASEQILNLQIKIASNARLELNTLGVCDHMQVFDVQVLCEGKNSTLDIAHLSSCTAKAKASDRFSLNFLNQNNKADMLLQTLAMDYSKVQSLGKINISEKARLTDSNMKQEVLLLDKSATALAVPELVICTNDVKAGHGVSIAKIDAEKLFYLMSRGLSRSQSFDLIVESYRQVMLERMQ